MIRFGVVVALLTAVASVNTAAGQTEVGRVTMLAGSGAIDRAGQQLPLAEAIAIFPDDIVTTAPNGRVRMKFADDTELTLGGDGEVVIDEFVYANAATDSAVFKLAKGPVRMLAGALERSNRAGMRIDTPAASRA
jgi:hypothetical protein